MMEQISLALPSHGVTQPVTLAPDPASMAPTDEIAAWADTHQRALLIDFYAAVQDKPLDVVADAIRAACQRGFGVWMEPPAGNPAKSIRPGTHLIEAALFGVTGSGLTPLEAANSWRISARRVLEDTEAAA